MAADAAELGSYIVWNILSGTLAGKDKSCNWWKNITVFNFKVSLRR